MEPPNHGSLTIQTIMNDISMIRATFHAYIYIVYRIFSICQYPIFNFRQIHFHVSLFLGIFSCIDA